MQHADSLWFLEDLDWDGIQGQYQDRLQTHTLLRDRTFVIT